MAITKVTHHCASRLCRSMLPASTQRVLHQGKGIQSSVYLVEVEGQKAVVKDYAGTSWYFRAFVAPYLVWRETRALRVLQGVTGVPQFYGKIDHHAFALEYIEGKPISELAQDELNEEIFLRVQQAIDGIHQRHVAHGDLKRRTNFMVTVQGKVIIVDYASAVIGGCWWRPFTNWVQRQMAQIDNKAVAKIKKLGAPMLMTEKEWDLLNRPTPLEKWARKLLKK